MLMQEASKRLIYCDVCHYEFGRGNGSSLYYLGEEYSTQDLDCPHCERLAREKAQNLSESASAMKAILKAVGGPSFDEVATSKPTEHQKTKPKDWGTF